MKKDEMYKLLNKLQDGNYLLSILKSETGRKSVMKLAYVFHTMIDDFIETRKRILPDEQPVFNDFDICFRCENKDNAGGDFIYFKNGNESLDIIIGDVSDGGMSALIIESQIHVLFRMEEAWDTQKLMKKMNTYLCKHRKRDKFSNLICAELTNNKFVYCNAGMENPIILSEQEIEKTDVKSVSLGMIEKPKYKKSEISLNNGNAIILYTSRLVDCLGQGLPGKGYEALVEILNNSKNLDAEEIVSKVYLEAESNDSSTGKYIEGTLLVIK